MKETAFYTHWSLSNWPCTRCFTANRHNKEQEHLGQLHCKSIRFKRQTIEKFGCTVDQNINMQSRAHTFSEKNKEHQKTLIIQIHVDKDYTYLQALGCHAKSVIWEICQLRQTKSCQTRRRMRRNKRLWCLHCVALIAPLFPHITYGWTERRRLHW